ncbi:P-selectin [Scomber japonicus]|uniref:P-selectin n=1 Tax=Scomber japonicus TaxID=13676 RepID=UPI00230562CB|nr:P-selectin [Scomber japonicus]
MLQESVNVRQSLHHRVLIAVLIVLVQDLSSGGGAQAWTYSYSTSPNRRWLEAREWCQQHSTGMVVIQNQDETDFLNELLPYHSKYYWIGILKVKGMWTRIGTEEVVGEENQNWAPAEPDNIAGQYCVEMYIKRDTDTAKWNNEKCTKKKGTVCYTVSCKQDSCSAHADCVETVGNYTCQCHPGFQGPRCEEAITCEPLLNLEQGSHNCLHPFGSNRFNSSCHFHCELGFRLVGAPQLLCQASGHWDHPVPLCQAEQCPVLNHTKISGRNMNCSHPIAPYSYNSTCEIRCEEGYWLSGQDHIRCDHTGQWTASVPTCSVQKCSSIFFPTGNMTCVDTVEPFSFGSECNFSCQEGFYLIGENTITCLASGNWSKPTPTCAVVLCDSLMVPPHASMKCQDPLSAYSYGSVCTVKCEEGFDLIGTNMTKCLSQGNWSHALPLCQAKRCHPINSPPHGSLSCNDTNGSFSFGSKCVTTCEEGFLMNGTAESECNSLGMWSADIPHCQARKCPTLNFPPHGSFVCADPHGEFSFGSHCTTACEEGFVLNGTADTECTSVGTWSTNIPRCLARRCPNLNSPTHGSLACSDPHGVFSFGSQCNSTCEEGFFLNGTAVTECTPVGIWSTEIPHCPARPCPLLVKAPQHGTVNCSHPYSLFSYGSHCDFECNEGFLLRGISATTCNKSGEWSQDVPTCQPKRCPTLNSTPHGSLACSGPHGAFNFGSHCMSTCEEGFVLNGTADTECTSVGTWSTNIPRCLARRCPNLNSPTHGSLACSDPHGVFSFGSQCNSTCEEGFFLNGTAVTECTPVGIWSTEIPHCPARPCPLLVKAPQHGTVNCSHPYSLFSYGSHCDFECNEGFLLRGISATTCNKSGEWSQDVPTCQPKRCPTLNSTPHGSLACSGPHGAFNFGSHCMSTCEEGFVLNGTADTECTSQGSWSTDIPHCFAKRCPILNSPTHGSLTCSDPHGAFSFGSQCKSTCEEGFVLNGTADTECTSVGTWSTELSHCLARSCPLLANAPQHGSMNCSHSYSPFSYGSRCDFECNEGFWMRGTSATTCNNSGHWSPDVPTCQPVQCEVIHPLSLRLSMECSHPLGNFSFDSQCRFTCKEGFFLNGTAVLICSSTGLWSDTLPTCIVEGLPVGSALLLYTGVGAATAIVPLVLIGLALGMMRLFKKKETPMIADEDGAWEQQENPAFEL